MAERMRVIIAEDHQVLREGLQALLGADPTLEIVGEAGDGETAVELAATRASDVVVMDIGLPKLDGIAATARLRARRPEVKVVILSMHDDAATVDRALRAGACAYVLKGDGVASLRDAIAAAARGDTYLSPGVAGHVVRGYLDSQPPVVEELSEREVDVLRLIAEGYTGREIAEQLGLKPKTVDNHRARIMEKLDIHTTAGLVRYALARGIATLERMT